MSGRVVRPPAVQSTVVARHVHPRGHSSAVTHSPAYRDTVPSVPVHGKGNGDTVVGLCLYLREGVLVL